MLLEEGKKKDDTKNIQKVQQQKVQQRPKINENVLNFGLSLGLKKEEIQRTINENFERIEYLKKKLIAGRGKSIKINGKGYGFVSKSVSDQELEDYISIAIIAEKPFKIKAEYLLAIATQESNLKEPKNGAGYYQIIGITLKELKKPQTYKRICDKLKTNGAPISEEKLNEIYKLLLEDKLMQNFGTQTILCCLVLTLKEIEKKPKNLEELAAAYNGSKNKEKYAKEVMTRYLYLRGLMYVEERGVKK